MTNYVKSTNFTSKDSLATGNPLKIIKGAEFDVEFNNIAVAVASKADTTAISAAIASKADINSPTFTGTPTVPTATLGTDTGQAASTAFVQDAIQILYPVGSIYINATNGTNPSTLFGFGTWVAFGAGRFPVGLNAADPLFDTAEETGGSKDAAVVSHTHTFSTTTDSAGAHSHTVPTVTAFEGGSSGSQYASASTPSTTLNTSTAGAHTHTLSGTTNSTGSSGTNANLPPYITVYMWKRTA